NEVIVISEKVNGLVSLPEKTEYEIVNTSNFKDIVSKLVSEYRLYPVLVVFFIHINDYPKLYELLTVLPTPDIIHKYVIFGSEDELNNAKIQEFYTISEFKTSKISEIEFNLIVKKSFALMLEFYDEKKIQNEYHAKLIDTRHDQEDLINIGKALQSEKDPDNLFRLILFLSKKITGADAGSIYVVEADENGGKRLRFKYSHTFSREIPLEEFVMDMNKKSIAGYVAVTGDVLNIPDVYNLPSSATYSFNKSFDKSNNYICRSMLVVPMKNHLDEIIGVIQLINSKEDILNRLNSEENEAFNLMLESIEDFDNYVVTFDSKYDSLLEAIAGQAAIAIENNRMIKQIQSQFEEFVKASVTAVESRDPATSGHSFRVAEICKAMVVAINEEKGGSFKDVEFKENEIREIELAALLHDFGKVYIDLNIFMKAKKLFPKDLDNLSIRLDYLYRFTELEYSIKEKNLLKEDNKGKVEKEIEKLNKEKKDKLSEIKEIKEKVIVLNEPTVTDRDPEEVLNEIIEGIQKMECYDVENEKVDVINNDDRLNLCIKRGSLNPLERKEIESHVVHTHNFVSKIPWPPEYKNIPEIALRHHETLDGSGYPNGIKGKDNLLIQSRIMTVADIYDALSATDRPYKKAVPLKKVLEILKEEGDRGKLDSELVDVFINHRIYEKIDKNSFKLMGNANCE
ncbi:HD domain-containing phosphohydrolase, partial [Spirochaetota bacterium]